MPYEDLNAVAVPLPTAEGTLEGRLVFGGEPEGVGVLLCPPHPLLAGNIDNNVVTGIAREVARAGLPVLLFNYRGVGGSFHPRPSMPLFEYWSGLDAEGTYDGAVRDVEGAFGWAQATFGAVHVVGYSFGAFVAACSARLRAEARSWCLVAPPWGAHDFGALRELDVPCAVVEASEDGLVPGGPLPIGKADRVVIPATDHFFRGREEAVGCAVASILARAMGATGARPASPGTAAR